jgi:hypothetical protein
MSISLIVMGVATTMLLSGTNMAQSTTQHAIEEQILDGVFDYVQDRLLFAGIVEKGETSDLAGPLTEGTGLLYVSENGTASASHGMLFYRHAPDMPTSTNVMGPDYYMGYSVSLEATVTTVSNKKPIVFVKVKLHSKTAPDTVISERERTFTLINGTPATGDSSDLEIASPGFLRFGPSVPASSPEP